MSECACIRNYTRRQAQKALDYRPLDIANQIRPLLFQWYGVESIDELVQFHWDAAVAWNKFYSVLWLPLYAKMEEIGYQPDPACPFCAGTGNLSYTKEEPEYGID